MTSPAVQFRAAGAPATQGSVRAVKPKGAKHARIIDNNQAKLHPWRATVTDAARETIGLHWVPLTGPVRVDLWFALPKPASAPKRARTWPSRTRTGDLDKLSRAILDALTDAKVWADDAQVVELRAVKDWPEHVQQMTPGVIVRVWRVEPDVPPPATTGQLSLIAQQETTTP